LHFVFRALNKAFSAPNICTVDAGYFDNVDKLPACAINLAAMVYPNISVKFGATEDILLFK